MNKVIRVLLVITAFVTNPVLAANRKLAWDPNSEPTLAGYKVYFGTESRGCHGDPIAEDFIYAGGAADQGGSPIVVFLDELADPTNPSYVLVNVPDNVDSFSVTAFSTTGAESRYSDELQLGVQGPFVCAASADTAMSIAVDYNEFVDKATASNPQNYNLRNSQNSPLPILSVSYDTATKKNVTLQRAVDLTPGETYTLSISNVVDSSSNGAVIAPNSQFTFRYTNEPSIRFVGPLYHAPPQIKLEFSEAVSSSAAVAGNYLFDNGQVVNLAEKAADRNFSDNQREVNLATTSLTEGTTYTVTVNNVEDMFGNSIAPSSTASFTVPIDHTAPIPLSSHVTSPSLKNTEIKVVFNVEIDPASAITRSNYIVSGGIIVNNATLLGDNKTVRLSTSAHVKGLYSIAISGITDSSAAKNRMVPVVLGYRVVDAITDSDGDGREDVRDNCTTVPNPDQRDTDGDKFGNLCDADFNNDGVVNILDLGIMRSVFLTANPNADLNGDGVVNIFDLARLRSLFLKPPGPSGTAPP